MQKFGFKPKITHFLTLNTYEFNLKLFERKNVTETFEQNIVLFII